MASPDHLGEELGVTFGLPRQDEESGLGPMLVEDVEDPWGHFWVWSVVIGEMEDGCFGLDRYG
jgi:hypothetical protein